MEIDRLSLNSCGRAAQSVQSGSFLMRRINNTLEVLRVDRICGVAQASGSVQWTAFFGPVWTCIRNDDLFEVFEFNARMHVQEQQWWGIAEIELPCWVRHLHRFPELNGRNVCEGLTEDCVGRNVFECCRFEMDCTQHEDFKDGFCEDCFEELTRGRHAPGTDGFVQVALLI